MKIYCSVNIVVLGHWLGRFWYVIIAVRKVKILYEYVVY
jgi:hypothetical protein